MSYLEMLKFGVKRGLWSRKYFRNFPLRFKIRWLMPKVMRVENKWCVLLPYGWCARVSAFEVGR